MFWKWPFRCIYVNSFSRLRFLAGVGKNLQKIHFFEKCKDHNLGREHGNSLNDPVFSSTFYALTVWNIHFWIENTQNLFSCGVTFGPFWSVKYLNLSQKLPIRTAHHTFPESRHPEVTKNLCYVLFTRWSQIPIF